MVDILSGDLPRDPALPSLAVAADPVAMRDVLEPHFDGMRLLGVRITRFAYKPGRKVRLCYRLKLRCPQTGAKKHHVLHGWLRPGVGPPPPDRSWAEPRHGPAFLVLDRLGMLLYGFPNDPELGEIASVAEPRGLLLRLRDTGVLDDLAGVECDSRIVKYVPGRRLVMQHKLRVGDHRWILYGKTYAHRRGEFLLGVLQRLWDGCSRDPDALLVPEPLVYLKPERTLLTRGLPGLVPDAGFGNGNLEEDMRRVGHGLAILQTSSTDSLQPWTETDMLADFEAATRELLAHDPALAPRVERLRRLALDGKPAAGSQPPVTAHGAFRFTQFLRVRDRLALLDFDGICAGHPMLDVGSFASHLEYLAVKGELEPHASRRALREFLDAYASRAPWGIPEPALQWYTGVHLVSKHAKKCVKRMKSDPDTKIRRFLERAESILSGEDLLYTRGDDHAP